MQVSSAIRRAVLVALASPACSSGTGPAADAGIDAPTPDAYADDAVGADATDEDASIDDASVFEAPYIPLPDGCIVSGKPDHFVPCGYTEALNDPTACTIEPDAADGIQMANVCYALCSWDEPDCYFYDLGEAGAYLTCGAGCIGRFDARSHGALDACVPLRDTPGDYLARAAQMEAASIDTFAIVERELRTFGAPARLVRDARRARADELRHARLVAQLARNHGGRPRRPPGARYRLRSLVEFATENAIEGCVREAFGAAMAAWQARTAHDASIRAAMTVLARDEARHATLAFEIAGWADSKLDSSARARVHGARARAIDALRVSFESPSPALMETLGLPDGPTARVVHAALTQTLWRS